MGDKTEETCEELDIVMNDPRVLLDCGCSNNSFMLYVVPKISTGGAQILNVICISCKRLYPVSDTGAIGEKSAIVTDSLGRKHHRIIAKGGRVGTKN